MFRILRCSNKRGFASYPVLKRRSLAIPSNKSASSVAPFPVVATCPSPTCQCRPTPEGLDIDHKQPLNGTMAAYSEHVVISTGRIDWAGRIEDEVDEGQVVLVRELKRLLGQHGKYSDVC